MESSEEEDEPKVLDGVSNVNLDDSDEDDDAVLANDFREEKKAVEEEEDDDSDSLEEELPKLPPREEEEEDEDDDDESVEEELAVKAAVKNVYPKLSDIDDSDSEEEVVKESAEELPSELVQPAARIIIVQSRGMMEVIDSDSDKDNSVEEEQPEPEMLFPASKRTEDRDSDSDSDSSEEDEEEEVPFYKRADTRYTRQFLLQFHSVQCSECCASRCFPSSSSPLFCWFANVAACWTPRVLVTSL